MAKHTPGPWRYWTCRIDNNTGMENYVQFANPNGYVFRAPLYYLREEDARLIAAAPDLLDALEKAKSALARCFGAHASDEGDRHRALAQARAAIAKATGEHDGKNT